MAAKIKRVHNPDQPLRSTIGAMMIGDFGWSEQGHLFYASATTAICLTAPEKSYSHGRQGVSVVVRIIPAGTIIELEVRPGKLGVPRQDDLSGDA